MFGFGCVRINCASPLVKGTIQCIVYCTCRKVLLKVLQGSTGPFTQMLGSLFLQAAVVVPLHVACGMRHGQNQRWDNITQKLHNNLGNPLPGCPASPPHGDTLTLSLIHHHLFTSIYHHASPTTPASLTSTSENIKFHVNSRCKTYF